MRRWFVKFLTDKWLKAITVDDLLRIEDGHVFIGKRRLTREELGLLKEDAEFVKNSLLWKLIYNNVYWIANVKMQKGERKPEDQDFGRATMYSIEVIEEFLEKLKLIR